MPKHRARQISLDKTKFWEFWERVDRSGGSDACWPCKGIVSVPVGDGLTMTPKRAAYALTHGYVPSFLQSKCKRYNCCNPAHYSEGRPNAKLNEVDCRAIKALRMPPNPMPYWRIAKLFGISTPMAHHVANSNRWHHV